MADPADLWLPGRSPRPTAPRQARQRERPRMGRMWFPPTQKCLPCELTWRREKYATLTPLALNLQVPCTVTLDRPEAAKESTRPGRIASGTDGEDRAQGH